MLLTRALGLVLLAAVALSASAGEATLLRRSAPSNEDPNGARVIVRYKASSAMMKALSAASSGQRLGPLNAATMAQRLGLQLSDGHLLDTGTQVLHGDNSISSAELARRLSADPDVEFAVPDHRRRALSAAPNDPLLAASNNISPAAGQWYLAAPDATFISAINAQAAWNITTGSSSIVVADIDTGVVTSHPDLANKLYPGYSFVSTSGNNLGSGWFAGGGDPGDYTAANQCNDGAGATNSDWHGTQVIGLIGAQTDNGIGMASIGRNVMLLPVRALGPCGGYDSDIMAGILWAAGVPLPTNDPALPNPGGVPNNPHPARIINLSLGYADTCEPSGSSPGLIYAKYFPGLVNAGLVIVAAAGNDEGLAVGAPANCNGVIAVAGIRNVGTKVGYSDVGPEVALSAPAGNCHNSDTPVNSGLYPPSLPCLYPLLSASNTGTRGPAVNTYTTGTNTSGTELGLGTSFASPLVAGTVALMLSANPTLQPAQVKAMLQTASRTFPTFSADPSVPNVPQCRAPNGIAQDECICTTSTCGAGMLDAGAAVAAAAAAYVAPPTVSITASSLTPTAGTSVTLTAQATASAGLTIASYLWEVTSGSSFAALTGATAASTATLATSAAGSVTVQVTVTDSGGGVTTQQQVLTVQAASAPSGSGGGSSSGGGGALSATWLALLAAAVVALRAPWRRPRKAPPSPAP